MGGAVEMSVKLICTGEASPPGWPSSPFPPVQPANADELVVPARDGTVRVLGLALDAGVERVVVTSSVAAVGGSRGSSDEPLDEESWTDLSNESISPYVRSKTVAEQAAWELARKRGDAQRLAVVNPGAILGPVLNDDLSFSLELIKRLLEGMPGIPRIGFSFVDVRDVVDLELRAMTAPEAGGERFIAVSDFRWVEALAGALREELGADASRVPKRRLPDLLVKAAGLFDPGIRSVVGQLNRRLEYSSAKARALGWQPRTPEVAAVDTARTMIERGVLST
jgi:nucleoside-diphosphate-sugar epimerase